MATNFPGVYTRLIDQSFNNGITSRFTCGLVGVAAQGPFNESVACPSLGAFVSNFGTGLAGSFLAQAVAAVAANSDGSNVVRVGTQFDDVTIVGSGAAGTYRIYTPDAAFFSVNDYIRAAQLGLPSTLDAVVSGVGSNYIDLVSVGVQAVPLAATYAGATVGRSTVAHSANAAEGFLDAPTWGTVVSAAGTVIGTKSAFTFTVSSDPTQISAGDVLMITQTNRATTREVTVSAVAPDGTVSLIPSTNTETGEQALPLQDNYTDGAIQKMVSPTAGGVALHLAAATAGTWANSVGNAGLAVQVSPGSAPDTKKLIVYYNGTVVEVVDNLSMDPASDNYYTTLLASDPFVRVLGVLSSDPPSNTRAPWNLALYTPSNTATFDNGQNGENVSAADYVGTIDPSDDSRTGLKVFDDPSAEDLAVLCVPGVTDQAVVQELNRVALEIHAVAIVDVPDGLNGREAIDWQAAAGLYSGYSRIDSYAIAIFWNWIKVTNPFTGVTEWDPPSIGVLGAMAKVFDQFGPWFATAGEVRGRLPQASAVRYPRVSEDVKQAMMGNGNSLNPILLYRGNAILIYGDRTAQREESKLTALHTVNLVNFILKSMAVIARHYVFDPNDSVLLNQLTNEFTQFLNSVQTGRGLEQYQLVCDDTNNTAATRNARNVIVDLAVIPTDVAERIFINVTVNQSGAQLNAVSGVAPPVFS